MLKIFSYIDKNKKNFTTFLKKEVKLYVCGITISNYCHLGHARTFCFFDILIKYLKYLGYKVTYVRNITDIDDKIIKKSLYKNISLKKLSKKMILSMNNDFNKLNLLIPDYEPRISNNLNLIINSIRFLLLKKYAYINKDGDILFNSKYFNMKNYNLISKLKLNNSENYDFVLWKKNINYINYSWHSPWGLGRPGWHIECSVLSNKFLGNKIDIHGGGKDLICPHHKNEFILSKCLFNVDYSIKYWIYVGLVIYNGKKISKSKNNMFFLKDLLDRYCPDVIKYYLMSTHYRKNIDYDPEILYISKKSVYKLYLCLYDLNLDLLLNKKDILIFKEFDDIFIKYMNDDLNIPSIQRFLFFIVSEINKYKSKKYIFYSKLGIRMKYYAGFLNILQYNVNDFLNKKYLKNNFYNNLILKINNLIIKRNLARRQSNWIKADYIRKKLLKLNITLIDKNNFITKWFFN